MADGSNSPEGGDYVITGSTSSDPSGTEPGGGSPTGATFSFADSFTGSSKSTGVGATGDAGPSIADAPVGKKRRGRQPYPRDADGNIIRPAPGEGGGTTGASDKGKQNGMAVKKVRNDRAAMKMQVQTFFTLAAQFTRMPHWLLSEQEASMEAEATCNLADSMGWNLSVGDSPIGAAVIFAVTTFSIVKPRIDETVRVANAVNVTPTRPATAGEARAEAQSRQGGQFDFSADLAATVNNGAMN